MLERPPPHPRLRRRKRPAAAISYNSTPNHRYLIPLLLAAVSRIDRPHSRTLIRRLLRSHLALIRTSRDLPLRRALPEGLLALLPALLATRYSLLLALVVAAVGTISLSSLEANMALASNEGVIDGLVKALGGFEKGKKKVVEVVCNTILDLSTTPFARELLSDSLLLVKLLSVLCQLGTSAVQSPSGYTSSGQGKELFEITFLKDKLSQVVLDAALALTNACNTKLLSNIPKQLFLSSQGLLKKLWLRSRYLSPIKSSEQELVCSRRRELAGAVFMLSLNESHNSSCEVDAVRRGFFGKLDSKFDHFLSIYWEDSPLLCRPQLEDSENHILSALFHLFAGKTINAVLDSILHGLTSCPPITADELDALDLLKEVRGNLGSHLVYGQDIRFVKTHRSNSSTAQGYPEKEVHYFKGQTSSESMDNSEVIFIDDSSKCKQAFSEGFTIALRGLELRSKEVATVANSLATLFGQPSVGANLYITPPQSQGLSRHYDDHCVFVCQLFGQKQWVLFPHDVHLLPRLYEPLVNFLRSDCHYNPHEGKPTSLQEGDILYIPRGYPHEAHTVIQDGTSKLEEMDGVSIHLTFAIEVEPPFEWEGFVHIALHCWNEKRKSSYCNISHYSTIVNMLHVAIRDIGIHEPILRKACLAGAFSSSDSKREQNLSTCKSIFHDITSKIDANSSFSKILSNIKAIISKRDELAFHWMRWLRHLPQDGQDSKRTDFDTMFEDFQNFVLLSDGKIDEVDILFYQIKSKFCQEIIFEDACKSFMTLLEKYRRTRRQYKNGMLSLCGAT